MVVGRTTRASGRRNELLRGSEKKDRFWDPDVMIWSARWPEALARELATIPAPRAGVEQPAPEPLLTSRGGCPTGPRRASIGTVRGRQQWRDRGGDNMG